MLVLMACMLGNMAQVAGEEEAGTAVRCQMAAMRASKTVKETATRTGTTTRMICLNSRTTRCVSGSSLLSNSVAGLG